MAELDNLVSLTWNADPAAEENLIEELYETVAMSPPDAAPAEETRRAWSLVGAVAARRDGQLLGWAGVYASADSADVALVQHMFVPRAARRLTTRSYDTHPATDQERDVVVALYRSAAKHARKAGYEFLQWSDAEHGPAGQAAEALNADRLSEFGEHGAEHYVEYQLRLSD